jgi:hypothetical protein
VEQDDTVTSSINGNKITCEQIECFASTAELLRPKKKASVELLSTITLGYIRNKSPNKKKDEEYNRLRVLFDSGCSATLINKKFIRHWKKTARKPTKWSTKAGSFKTNRQCEIQFTLPAFHENRDISCNAYVDESLPETSSYDMIIGRDLMHSLGINLLFDTSEMCWDNAKVKMLPPQSLEVNWVENLEKEVLFAHDPDTTS